METGHGPISKGFCPLKSGGYDLQTEILNANKILGVIEAVRLETARLEAVHLFVVNPFLKETAVFGNVQPRLPGSKTMDCEIDGAGVMANGYAID
jgi:hypothetical protein